MRVQGTGGTLVVKAEMILAARLAARRVISTQALHTPSLRGTVGGCGRAVSVQTALGTLSEGAMGGRRTTVLVRGALGTTGVGVTVGAIRQALRSQSGVALRR